MRHCLPLASPEFEDEDEEDDESEEGEDGDEDLPTPSNQQCGQPFFPLPLPLPLQKPFQRQPLPPRRNVDIVQGAGTS